MSPLSLETLQGGVPVLICWETDQTRPGAQITPCLTAQAFVRYLQRGPDLGPYVLDFTEARIERDRLYGQAEGVWLRVSD